MRLQIAYVTARRELKSGPAQVLVQEYVGRCQRLNPASLESFRTEAAFLEAMARRNGRTPAVAVLLDSRGRSLSSVTFAEWLGAQRDAGAQEIVLAIGPPDGWSGEARQRAQLLLSLGAMTLPHELALVILAEQTYRALTILAGHPYHSGHE